MSELQNILASESSEGSSKVFFQYLADKANTRGTPLRGVFELTPRCTLDCAMCYVHLNQEQMHCPEMSTEQWIELVKSACDEGMMFARVTGGECMLHPGFKQICEALLNRGVLVSILTNGTLIDEEMADWLARYPFEVVQVSVYGSSEKGYATVTGNASAFAKVDRALTLLKERGIRFTTPVTLSRQIAPDFIKTVHYCQSKGPQKVLVSPNPFPARPETGRRTDSYDLTLDEEIALYKQYYDETGVLYEPCSVEEVANQTEAIPEVKGIACQAGKSAFSISWDGWMLPCATLYWMKVNLLKQGFEKAWQETRKLASAFCYPDKCMSCKLRTSCYVCPILHYDTKSSAITLNQEVCKKTLRIVTEGLR